MFGCPLQVGGGTAGGRMATAAASGSVVRTFCSIGQEEGIMGYFKGNLPQVRRCPHLDMLCAAATFTAIPAMHIHEIIAHFC